MKSEVRQGDGRHDPAGAETAKRHTPAISLSHPAPGRPAPSRSPRFHHQAVRPALSLISLASKHQLGYRGTQMGRQSRPASPSVEKRLPAICHRSNWCLTLPAGAGSLPPSRRSAVRVDAAGVAIVVVSFISLHRARLDSVPAPMPCPACHAGCDSLRCRGAEPIDPLCADTGDPGGAGEHRRHRHAWAHSGAGLGRVRGPRARYPRRGVDGRVPGE